MSKNLHHNNSLSAKFPQLLEEWHWQKNNELTPYDITYGSKKKVWWKCKEKGHEYESSVNSRTNPNTLTGCPYCSSNKVSIDNCLATIMPILANEWHPVKNGNLTPFDFTAFSKKKVWWIGSCGHEWDMAISQRTSKKDGCPYCAGMRVNSENSLLSCNPELSKEWNQTKNGNLTPNNVTPNSKKKVWWTCSICNHEWKTGIGARNKRKCGCPKCASRYHTSFPEQALEYYLSKIFPNTVHRYQYDYNQKKIELDLYIPELKIGIEYDGYWHISKTEQDESKNKNVFDSGLTLIRIRTSSKRYILPKINPYGCVIFNHYIENSHNYDSFASVISNVITWILDKKLPKLNSNQIKIMNSLEIDLKKDCIIINQKYITSTLKNSIVVTHPLIVNQWNYDKNGSLRPESFTHGSGKKVWWICDKGHEWIQTIQSRTSGKRCPFCCGQRVSLDNCLATTHRDLSEQWHPHKNGVVTPYDVTKGSSKRAWWICNYEHEWNASINGRIRNDGKITQCPTCYKKKIKK
ncbi:zinc-ribbon domain-containing protein [Brevibacillus sp. NRS-1366]|uniref:zinc-ribbon domain-containing protein n=1 Tax=Brevibacillus sp. NRS-1366 TaxID=3233899 RepID=UPI003D1FB635